jgi:hypothetical protein
VDRRFAGGIARVAALLAEHGGAVEADLLRYYQVHVGDFPWPLTARQVLVLVSQLPDDSALMRAVHGEEQAQWSLDRHLLARIEEGIRGVQYQIAVISGAKNPIPPEPIPRPGVRRSRPPRPEVDRALVKERLAARGVVIPDELLQ